MFRAPFSTMRSNLFYKAASFLFLPSLLILGLGCDSSGDSSSGIGLKASRAGIIVEDPFFGALQATGISQSEVRINWSIENAQNIDWVALKYKADGETSYRDHNASLGATATAFLMTGLSPDVTYSFKLVAKPHDSEALTSQEFIGATLATGTQGFEAPTNLETQNDTDSIKITWDYEITDTILDQLDNAQGDYYFEVLKNNGQTLVGTTQDMEITDTNILPCTQYTYTVRFVFPGIGSSPETAVESQSLGTASLPDVNNFHATSGQGYVTLGWDQYQTSANSGYYYQIKMTPTASVTDPDAATFLSNADHLDAVAKSFPFHTPFHGVYYFWIRLIQDNTCNYSPWTDRLSGIVQQIPTPENCAEQSGMQNTNGIVTPGC